MSSRGHFNSRPLSPAELKIISNTKLSHRTVAEKLNRSYGSIKYHRKRLNIIVEDAAKEVDRWTDTDKQTLVDHVGYTDVELARIIGKTKGSIANMRFKMKLKSSKNFFSANDINYITENYHKKSVKQIANHLDRSVSSIQSIAHNLGVTKKNVFWTKAEIEILQLNINLPPSELITLLTKKSAAQITYKKSHINYYNKLKTKDVSGIDSDVPIPKHPIILKYIEHCNSIDPGQSFEFPGADKFYLNAAVRELAHKRFVTRRVDDTTRRIWRID